MGEQLRRGVKRAPYTVRGRPVMIVIDSFGNLVRQVALKPGASPVRVADWLELWLDRTHPVPRLELVQEKPRQSVVREIDPRWYSDPRSPLVKQRYLRGLARNAANRLPPVRRGDI